MISLAGIAISAVLIIALAIALPTYRPYDDDDVDGEVAA